MTRLLEIIVALVIVAILGVLFGVALPAHRHIERSAEVSSPVRQIYDVIDGFHSYPSWTALRAYDPRVRMTLDGPEQGAGAKVSWLSPDPRIGNGNMEVSAVPAPEQDSQVTWNLSNDWKGDNKHYTIDIIPAQNGKTVKIRMGYDVDYGWDLLGRYAGMYLEGDPATQLQIHLTKLQDMLATFPNVDYKDQQFEVKDIVGKPVIYVKTTAKRNLEDIGTATDAAMAQLQAVVKKDKLTVSGPRTTITDNYGDENYDFDIALPVDRVDASVVDPVKSDTSFTGKALVTSFTGSPAQVPLARLMLKAYAYTHGYSIDESGEGSGRFYDELTSEPNVAEDEQAFSVYLPVQLQ